MLFIDDELNHDGIREALIGRYELDPFFTFCDK